MNELDIATDLATLKNEQKHIRKSIDEINETLKGQCDLNRNVVVYKRLTWANLGILLSAAGAALWK